MYIKENHIGYLSSNICDNKCKLSSSNLLDIHIKKTNEIPSQKINHNISNHLENISSDIFSKDQSYKFRESSKTITQAINLLDTYKCVTDYVNEVLDVRKNNTELITLLICLFVNKISNNNNSNKTDMLFSIKYTVNTPKIYLNILLDTVLKLPAPINQNNNFSRLIQLQDKINIENKLYNFKSSEEDIHKIKSQLKSVINDFRCNNLKNDSWLEDAKHLYGLLKTNPIDIDYFIDIQISKNSIVSKIGKHIILNGACNEACLLVAKKLFDKNIPFATIGAGNINSENHLFIISGEEDNLNYIFNWNNGRLKSDINFNNLIKPNTFIFDAWDGYIYEVNDNNQAQIADYFLQTLKKSNVVTNNSIINFELIFSYKKTGYGA